MHFRNWSDEFLERYRKEGDTVIIELAIKSPYDLYDNIDPSPIKVRDLKPNIVSYIIGCIREIPFDQPYRIDFCFYEFDEDEEGRNKLNQSVRVFFNHLSKLKMLEFKFKIINGLKSTLIGLCFLFFCIFTSSKLRIYQGSLFSSFFIEGLSVLGWVSLWNPVQIFLYEIWPILSYSRSLKRCSKSKMIFRHIDSLKGDREYID